MNLQPVLRNTEADYANGQAINLQSSLNPDSLRKLLAVGNYYSDERDINLIVDSLPAKLIINGPLSNLGALNKRLLAVQVPEAWESSIGGIDFQSRVQISRQSMGFDSVLYRKELMNPAPYAPNISVSSGAFTISGEVSDNGEPMVGVLVQLKRHPATSQPDTLEDRFVYARTDTEGQFNFTNLTTNEGYSVVPLKPGLEFGARKGTSNLTKNVRYTFEGRPHSLRLIGSVVYGQLKTEHTFTVRTPAEYKAYFWEVVTLFLLAFWAVHIFWSFRRFHPDALLLTILMLLTGLSVLTLLAIQDPLEDSLFAAQTVQGVWIGLIGMALVSQVNIGRLYADWRFDALFTYKSKSSFHLSGWTWLIVALSLALLTLAFGSGPEGSGVRVNLSLLGFSFQPSEITKFFLLLFFAGFFAANESQIRTLPDLRWRFGVSFGAMAGAGLVMGLYLLLGDMGPALVVCFTFLIFYSIARGNLLTTLLTGVGYCVLLWITSGLLTLLLSSVTVIGYLIWKGDARSKVGTGWLTLFFEPPLLLLLVLAAFTFGDQLPYVGDRLADRKAMWLNPWSNDVYGGDQLAHGFWTMATGGWSGQGVGKGFAKTMPAAHTDMILPSIGEELGGIGLIVIFILVGILLHRLFLHARRAGQPFSFFLTAGIAIATGAQFLLIGGGSLGLLPLTGISVPFLSYGKISLIINLVAMGLVFSVAKRPGDVSQRQYIVDHYDSVLLVGIGSFLAGVLALIVCLVPVITWRANDYVVRPARVVTRFGDPVYSYNPRIERLTYSLAAGTIFDRNGLILATSSADSIISQNDRLGQTELDPTLLDKLSRKRQKRYYPFGEHLFFWVGDLNTQLFQGQNNGYFAEAAHLGELRGFANRPRKTTLVTTNYRSDRFSPVVSQTRTLSVYDYDELATALREGIEGREMARRKAQNRDVRLSVDASLQVALQNAIARSDFKNRRVSVVVLNAGSGEVLASAVHPLPNLRATDAMLLSDRERQKLPYLVTERDLGMTYATAPGSTAKIITALAGLNKLGSKAADVTFFVARKEIIRKSKDGGESEPFDEQVNMEKAIVRSSNVYFIRMANEYELDNELANLYMTTGMNIDQIGGYSFTNTHSDADRYLIRRHWHDSSFVVNRSFYESPRYPKRYRSEFSGLAWGQGQLTATPVSLARFAGAIANEGILQPPRYVLSFGGISKPVSPGKQIARQAGYAEQIEQFMIAQSNPPGKPKISSVRVAGKTGTPQRGTSKHPIFDGWYVFIAPTTDGRSKTVVSIRIELGNSSGAAVALANTVLAPLLKEHGYLGSF